MLNTSEARAEKTVIEPEAKGGTQPPVSERHEVAHLRPEIEKRLEAYGQELQELVELYERDRERMKVQYQRDCERVEAHFERERGRIASLIQQSQSQYNSTLPIARLPSEIMSKIFEDYADEHWNAIFHDRPRPAAGASYKWLTILHVCRDWRRIALGTPQVWAFIPPLRAEYVNLALSKSGRLPLTIPDRPDYVAQDNASYRAILEELPRIRKAEFAVTDKLQQEFEDIEDTLDLQPLTLQDLSLHMFDDSDAATWLPVFSSADMPVLTSLQVERGPRALVSTLIRPTLTTLDVSFSPEIGAADFNSLVDILGHLPLLQRLGLSGFRSRSLPTDSLASCTVSLPHLKRLRFGGVAPSVPVAELLDCLTFPMDTAIFYDADPIAPNVESNLVLPMVVSKAINSTTGVQNSPSTKFRPYAIRFIQYVGLTVKLLAPPSPGTSSPPTRLYLSLQLYEDDADSIIELFELLDLSDVHRLNISFSMQRETWMDFLQNNPFSQLEKLGLSGDVNLEEWFSMLAEPLAQSSSLTPTGEAAKYHLFPNLKILVLNNCVLRRRDLPSIVQRLRELCIQRGSPFDELHIAKPDVLTFRTLFNSLSEADLAIFRDPGIARSVKIGGYWE
ncbi:hypothetical protein NM688_g7271 [Phlebia brevispora]|uniref:Uncharacterized protein n=1 Tax=Phlebia brevispora TaxID=194682 RepID=A0ACC1S778_9APHY|nr:hypothetical protein NM688_g7271 [Phlebia brevispora]